MAEATEIIKDIMTDGDDIIKDIGEVKQKVMKLHCKMLTLPGGKSISIEQAKAVDDAMDGLRFWRRNHLEVMLKAFEK